MTVLLVRHGDAGSRSSWTEPDELRPLVDRGRSQARGLVALLGDRWPIGRLVTSPSVRCIETLAPLATVLALDLALEDVLAEGTDPQEAFEIVRRESGPGAATVLCSHGDVIPGVLELVGAGGVDLGSRPMCQKGSAWYLEGDGDAVTRAAYLPPAT